MTDSQEQQKHFNEIAEMLSDGKITPEQACSMIEKLRDLGILADDILEPENQEQEKQKGFNEIAGVYSDWKVSKEEACELFVEWIDEWKNRA
jgi:DNA-binding Lrp family transcriptional regulator